MKESIDIFARVGVNCPSFYPDFASGKTCPDISRASCKNCRNFSVGDNRCIINMFDKVVDTVYMKKTDRFE
ncbi:MAG: hypothetical protein E7218_00790 [Anaerofustis stercorihominis]|nr:hypothetical protein [Anaerofustis stercorihominis]